MKSSIGALAPICVLAASCSLLERSPRPEPSAAPSITAAIVGARAAAKERKLPEPIEMTAARQAHPLSPGDWVLCVKSSAPDSAAHAVFFNADAVKGSRRAVQIDPCWNHSYQQLLK